LEIVKHNQSPTRSITGPERRLCGLLHDIWPIYTWDGVSGTAGNAGVLPADVRNNLKSKTPTKRRSRTIEAEDGTLTDRAYQSMMERNMNLTFPEVPSSHVVMVGRIQRCR
jgi:hypothetical protein